jgi:hypothetical protein
VIFINLIRALVGIKLWDAELHWRMDWSEKVVSEQNQSLDNRLMDYIDLSTRSLTHNKNESVDSYLKQGLIAP